MIDIYVEMKNLVAYGLQEGLIEEEDRVFVVNQLLDILGLHGYVETSGAPEVAPVEDLLARFRAWAVDQQVVPNDSNEVLDLLDTRIMGVFSPKPSVFRKDFYRRYEQSPKMATEFYYQYAKKINYIREQRVAKDIKWTYDTPYGTLDMTINLSKPEKDPRAIALASKGIMDGEEKYPLCLLCKENEGYAGRMGHPARQNHRIIPVTLAHEEWYMQYSPYVYYNEHCIVFKGNHDPMKISEKTVGRLLDFVKLFPHYIMGSNADLPIVGGSILTHDHFQGGHYDFAMSRAKETPMKKLEKLGVSVSKLYWPMSVIRLKGKDPEVLTQVFSGFLSRWKNYSDEQVALRSHTGETEHNTITPIARYREGHYEVDLVLRNNRTDEKHPHGIFHSAEQYHHIKRENIGLIECMGLAVLPARLREEMAQVKSKLLQGDLAGIYAEESLKKHGDFAKYLLEMDGPKDSEGLEELIYSEIGRVFMEVLESCGIFKNDPAGQEAFDRCMEVLYEGLE